MKMLFSMVRGAYVLVSLSIWILLYIWYIANILVVFTIKYMYKQIRLIYVCNYHNIYDKRVYRLWWDILTKTSLTEKVYLTYGSFSTRGYLNMYSSIFGNLNNMYSNVQEVINSIELKLHDYYSFNECDNVSLVKLAYFYTIIDDRIHLLEQSKNHQNNIVIKNLLSYYGRDLYKRSLNIKV